MTAPHRSLCLALLCVALGAACDRGATTPPAPPASAPTPPAAAEAPAAATPPPPAEVIRPAYLIERAARVIAVGDVHGDLPALKSALRAARVIDEQDRWIGAETVVVQTGDLLDRGDDEQEIIDFLDALGEQATRHGGQLLELIGNHEAMNVQGDLRYVTPGGFKDFEDVPGLDLSSPELATLPAMARARRAAFLPGGPYALQLAEHNTIGIVNDSVFVHGGVLPMHVDYGIARLNDEVAAWMRGDGEFPKEMQGDTAPIWTRFYSSPTTDPCPTLQRVLDALKVKRMVVGHTVQIGGIANACDGKLWMVDVGMARHYGGVPAALEILPDGTVTVHRAER